MAPHKVTGIAQYLVSSGPLAGCHDWTRGQCSIFPAAAESLVQELLAMEKENLPVPETPQRSSLSLAVKAIGGLKVADQSSSTWVLSQKPEYATVFSMLRLMRNLMIAAGNVCVTWTCEDMLTCELFVSGFGGRVLGLARTLTEAAGFETAAIDAVAALGAFQRGGSYGYAKHGSNPRVHSGGHRDRIDAVASGPKLHESCSRSADIP